MAKVSVVGGGLAGCEAAWQAANRGVAVDLYEMRPAVMTPAHHSGDLAELVCSNSLRAEGLGNAVGLLKEEMRRQGSLIISAADATRVPAGSALAVDRRQFSAMVTQRIREHPLIEVKPVEVRDWRSLIGAGPVVVAAGPLCSPALAASLQAVVGGEYLYFFDAAAPVVDGGSIDMARAWRGSRYRAGEGEYINCPLTEEEYRRFWQELVTAEVVKLKDFEDSRVFTGCMPVEVMAGRGIDTLRFGPLKPVGLPLPGSNRLAHAVVQLRQDNAAATLYNMVGFQTNLTWPEQRRVFRLIPGLERAEFVRYGVMHRNTYINSPRLLNRFGQLRQCPQLLFAGQITGVEGYVESAASGLMAGINAARLARGLAGLVWPAATAHGSLQRYLTRAGEDNFQPMHINFGLLPEAGGGRKARREAVAGRALAELTAFLATELNDAPEVKGSA